MFRQAAFLSFFCSCLINLSLSAQLRLSGNIRDKITGEPIEFAHIFFNSRQDIGVISNQLGQFSITVPEELQSDTLVITQIGYYHHYLPLRNVGSAGGEIGIELRPSAILLREAVVMAEGGLKHIVRKAFQHVPQNYPTDLHRLKAYYREYSIVDSVYAHQAEAFLTIQDKGRANKQEPWMCDCHIYVHEFRKTDDHRPEQVPSHLLWPTGDMIIRGYELGLVTQSSGFKMAFSPEQFIESTGFSYMGEDLLDKDTLIHIGFTNQRARVIRPDSSVHYPFIGELVINKTDYAIVRYRFAIDQSDSFWETQYRKLKGKYYLSRILKSFTLPLKQGTLSYNTSQLYHFYEVETDKKHFKPLGPHKKLSREQVEDIQFVYHPDFWNNNSILPEVPANKALERDLSRRQSLAEQYEENARRVE